MLGHKVIFTYFQPNSKRRPLVQSQNNGWNYYIARSKLHPANWTHLGTLAKRQASQVIWIKSNALPKMHVLAVPKK